MKRLAVLCAAALAGCATPYQADNGSGFMGGYTEQWISDRTLHVTVKTNGYTSARRAARLAMLRACELGDDTFRPYLAVIRAGSYRRTSTTQTRAAQDVHHVQPGSTVAYYSYTDPAQYRHVTRNVGDALVVMLNAAEFRAGYAGDNEVVDCWDFFKHQATPAEQMRVVGQVYDHRAGAWAPPPGR